MHMGLKIKALIESKNLNLQDVAVSLGKKTRQSMYDMFEREHVNSNELSALSKLLNIPVGYFFDEQEESLHTAPAAPADAYLEQRLDRLEAELKQLAKDVAVLEYRVKQAGG